MKKHALALLRTPTGWLLTLAVGAVLFLALALTTPSFLGLTFDPFGLKDRKIERLTNERDFAVSDASARGLEVEGEREQAGRVDHYFRQELVLTDLTARADAEARNATYANEPVEAGRLGRLGAADGELCRIRPAICLSAAPEPAIGGD